MTIYQIIDTAGKILRYQARIERDLIVYRQSFKTYQEAYVWLKDMNRQHPCKAACWRNKKIELKTKTLKALDSRGRPSYGLRPKMELNGCTLERAEAGIRCEKASDCSNYTKEKPEEGCLEASLKANWPGWTCQGRLF